MIGPRVTSDDQRVLILAPFGRDADLATKTLQNAGFSAYVVLSIFRLIEEINRGVGAILIAGETLNTSAMKSLSECMRNQPPWSDIPIILLTSDIIPQLQLNKPGIAFEEIGNVTFLPRPFTVRTLNSVVRFALRSRLRQYSMRELVLQLDEKTKELSRSNAEFESFAYTAAHDMREPVRMIESFLGIISHRFKDVLGTKGMSYISNASSAANRLQALLNSLLLYAHVGNGSIVALPVSSRSIAAAAVKNLSSLIAVTLGEVALPCDDTIVYGDEALLTQLLQNLIGNGLKFHKKESKPRVEVSWVVRTDQWICAVRDNGIGIPPEAHERIFAIFQRLHGINEYQGCGIGLATCRRIVDRHGGRIWVESEINVGATFYVSLPINSEISASSQPRSTHADYAHC